MKNPENISIILSGEVVDNYCLELERHVSTVEKRVTALDALKTFVATVTDPGEQSKPGYAAIRAALEHHIELARSELLDEHARALVEALRQRQLPRITHIFTALSRDGFRQLLARAENELGVESSRDVTEWCTDWLDRIRECSERVSPYPDTIDFEAVGISVAEYMVMTDLRNYFSHEKRSTQFTKP